MSLACAAARRESAGDLRHSRPVAAPSVPVSGGSGIRPTGGSVVTAQRFGLFALSIAAGTAIALAAPLAATADATADATGIAPPGITVPLVTSPLTTPTISTPPLPSDLPTVADPSLPT